MNLPAASATGSSPDLAAGAGYLVAPANLIDGHYYELFPGFADFGLTIDGAFALAATGSQDAALTELVNFLDQAGTDGSGNSVNFWTGIGTPDVSGGSLGKEALLAEVVGRDPHNFGGQDVLAALNASVCSGPSTAPDTSCAAAGNYTYATSVLSQSLGIIAQLRAGDSTAAAAPIGYLESLQDASGAWPSTIPSTGFLDVDSTAAAVMALNMLPDASAHTAVTAGLAWIAGRQAASGGFPGVNPDSVNSTALAVQALSLDQADYGSQISKALAFLAGQQNADGGFNIEPATPGSDIRASAQAVAGASGISFATLFHQVSALPSSTPSASPSATPTPTRTRTTTPASRSASATAPASAPIENAAVGAGQLANTGQHEKAPLLLGGLLLVVGVLLTVAGRRRSAGGRYR
jgi:hypothetical protein